MRRGARRSVAAAPRKEHPRSRGRPRATAEPDTTQRGLPSCVRRRRRARPPSGSRPGRRRRRRRARRGRGCARGTPRALAVVGGEGPDHGARAARDLVEERRVLGREARGRTRCPRRPRCGRPASRAPRCAAASMPSAPPETTTAPSASERRGESRARSRRRRARASREPTMATTRSASSEPPRVDERRRRPREAAQARRVARGSSGVRWRRMGGHALPSAGARARLRGAAPPTSPFEKSCTATSPPPESAKMSSL